MALSRFAFLLLAALSLSAATPPVELAPYPQKVRTFFKIGDPAVPAALRGELAPPVSVRSSDGATWSITPPGVTRVDERAPERDRRQYFAGRRYLPDDDPVQIVP